MIKTSKKLHLSFYSMLCLALHLSACMTYLFSDQVLEANATIVFIFL